MHGAEERTRRSSYWLAGAFVFVVVCGMVTTVVPAAFDSSAPPQPPSLPPEVATLLAARGREATAESSPTTRDPVRDVALADTARSVADLLTLDTLWQSADLSSWRAVDNLSALYLEGQGVKFGVPPGRGSELQALLLGAKSDRVRQVLLVMLGVLRGGEPEVLAPLTREPALTASAAYALGRTRSDIGEARLAELIRELPMGARREAGYFGYAQVGPTAIPQLTAASRAGLVLATPPDSLPLSFVREPDSRPALVDVVLHAKEVELRIAALEGYAAASCHVGAHERDYGWLVEIVASTSDERLRSAGLAALSQLDAGWALTVVDTMLERPSLGPALSSSLLRLMTACGASAKGLRWIETLIVGSATNSITKDALETLASMGGSEADALLARHLARLGDAELRLTLYAMSRRSAVRRPIGRQMEGVSETLMSAVAGLLERNGTTAEAERLMLLILKDSRDYRARAESIAWQRYSEHGANDVGRRTSLKEMLPVLGERGTSQLMAEFENCQEFVGRVELTNRLMGSLGRAALADSSEEVRRLERFLAERALPFLRSHLSTNTGAVLAYTGPRRSHARVDNLTATITRVFGRFGDAEDALALESVACSFATTHPEWSEKLRGAVETSFSEVAARIADLMAIKQKAR